MLKDSDNEQIIRNFRVRQTRQYLGIAVTLVLLVSLVLVYRRPDIFGEISKRIILFAQMICIVAFVVFSSLNWRCPACNRYLGNDIARLSCRRCGARFK